MSKVWITSDSHFSHVNIIKYCNRPFDNVETMNETIIKNWNNAVSKDDLVFHDLYVKTQNPTDARIFNIIFRKPNIKQHEQIIALRPHHTIKETATLVGCSVAQVKRVCAKAKKSSQLT